MEGKPVGIPDKVPRVFSRVVGRKPHLRALNFYKNLLYYPPLYNQNIETLQTRS